MLTAYPPPGGCLCALAPDPLLAALEDLLLPHGDGVLERVDDLAAGIHRGAAVSGRDGDDDARLADRDVARAVRNRDVEDLVAGLHPVRDARHLRLAPLPGGVVLE